MAISLWNKSSYRRRLFGLLIIYSILLVGSFTIFQYQREKQFKIDELNSQLQLINAVILNELEDNNQIQNLPLKNLHQFDDLRISVINPDGEVIYDNSLDSIPHSNHQNRKEIADARLHGSAYAVRRHSESTGQNYFYSARRGNNGLIVRTAVPYSINLNELLEADYSFLWIMGGITLVICAVGFLTTRRLGQHVERLRRFAQGVENGERISDTEPFTHDELGDISNHIVRLYARLQQAYSERDKEHKNALYEQQEKERIKKQLTNNINHELKTPVASIQVCLETLLQHPDLPAPKRIEFLERSLSNTARLKQLLLDVALITRMDDGQNSISCEKIDLARIIADVFYDSLPLAERKGIEIVNEILPSLWIRGNESLLFSVFHNLITNAISYSGGTRINIRRKNDNPDKFTIIVEDNGNGVADEHLPRLFERFYRVDKGRSRASGGTGLGLSIVKNAVLIHHGSISVENIKTGGLRFSISFPSQP